MSTVVCQIKLITQVLVKKNFAKGLQLTMVYSKYEGMMTEVSRQ